MAKAKRTPPERTPTGERIAALREAMGLKQREVADRVGTDYQQVSKWERGATLPDTPFLVPLADALQTTVDYILRNPGDAPRGLAEIIANAADIFGQRLTEEEIRWCRAEVRSHGDVPALEWASRIATRRRGLTPAQAAAEAAATKAAAAKGASLGVPRRK